MVPVACCEQACEASLKKPGRSVLLRADLDSHSGPQDRHWQYWHDGNCSLMKCNSNVVQESMW